jgi:tight adherence protein B
MLIILSGVWLGVACVILWAVRLFAPAWRHGATWIGKGTEAELAQLFMFISSRQLLRYTAAATVLMASVCFWTHVPLPLVLLVCTLVLIAPRLATSVLLRRRRRRVIAQLPDALQLWAGLLRSGQGMMSAVSQLTSRQPDPLGAELRLVLSEYRLGVPIDRAMHALQRRFGTSDLRMLSTLLRAHLELGGNLAEAMERLAATLRSRLAMEARIQSLTAQGRLQGVVVGLLPILLAFVLSFMEPAAIHALFSTPAGLACIAVILALETTGFVLIRRIVRIDT